MSSLRLVVLSQHIVITVNHSVLGIFFQEFDLHLELSSVVPVIVTLAVSDVFAAADFESAQEICHDAYVPI